MRAEMVDLAERHRLRHAHMVGVSRASMIGGFAADPDRVAEKARALTVHLRPRSRITARSAAGTDLVIALPANVRLSELGAVVTPGKAVNLPGGELIASPESVDGVCVADGTIGDAEGALARSLREMPLVLRIGSSRVQSVTCERDPAFARTVWRRLASVANLDRVALVVFGLNVGLGELVGDVATDQKAPGLHLSLGDTFPDRTGAAWTAMSWIGLALTGLDVDVDKKPVLRGGRYVV
jgi:leucyl aminopeptidase (aminopeptidase T)